MSISIVFFGCATQSKKKSQDKVDVLMKLSGLEQSIKNVSDQAAEEAKSNPALSRLFSQKHLRWTIHNALKTQLSESDINALVAWYRSPLGRKLMAPPQEDEVSIDEYIQEQRKKGNIDPKIKMALQIVHWSGSLRASSYVSASFLTMRSMPHMIRTPANLPQNPEELNVYVHSYLQAIEENIEVEMVAATMYAYRGMTDLELRGFTNFLQTDLAQRYTRVTTNAIEKAVLQAVFESVKAK
jgi:hypothetical protein